MNNTPFVARARESYPNAFKAWSAEDIDRLTEMALREESLEVMSQELGRGPQGLLMKLKALGLVESYADPAQIRPRGNFGLPVPQADHVPSYRCKAPNPKWVRETARFWGVDPDHFKDALDELDDDEWTVFVLRYGLPDRCSYTVRAVADELDLDAETVLALQAEAETIVVKELRGRGQCVDQLDLESTLRRRHRRAN